MNQLLGVVFCGGQSTRMAADKGLLNFDGTTWAAAAADKLTSLQCPIVVSVNPSQVNDYLNIFEQTQLVTDDETLLFKGPLAGLLSVHAKYPLHDLLVLACDMPFMEVVVLQQLVEAYVQQPAQAHLFVNGDEPEPLCAIYSSGALAKILHQAKEVGLKKHSMKFMLEQLTIVALPITEPQKKYFQNINAHAQLNGL